MIAHLPIAKTLTVMGGEWKALWAVAPSPATCDSSRILRKGLKYLECNAVGHWCALTSCLVYNGIPIMGISGTRRTQHGTHFQAPKELKKEEKEEVKKQPEDLLPKELTEPNAIWLHYS